MSSQSHLFGKSELRQLGRAVREARERVGLSQVQLADNAGLSLRPLRELEAGRSSPSLATIVALADALPLTLDGLIAAARTKQPQYGLLPAKDVRWGDNELVAGIDRQRARVRIADVGSDDGVSLPAGPVFAHVLRGVVTATLEGEQVKLRQGDSLHSCPGVLTDLAASDGRALVLLVEATGGL